MVKFNEGRFIIMFSSDARKVAAIYDTRDEAYYDVKHPAFRNVFETYVKMLPRDAAEELMAQLIETEYKSTVENILQ